MAAVLKVQDEPGSPTVGVLVDVGNLTSVVVNVPRAVYGTDVMQDLIDHAATVARDPSAVPYAQSRTKRGPS